MPSPKRLREGSSLVDVDDGGLGDDLLGGDPVANCLVPDLGTADFRGFGVDFALGLGVVLVLEGIVVEPSSDASKRVCVADEISVGASLATMPVSGC